MLNPEASAALDQIHGINTRYQKRIDELAESYRHALANDAANLLKDGLNVVGSLTALSGAAVAVGAASGAAVGAAAGTEVGPGPVTIAGAGGGAVVGAVAAGVGAVVYGASTLISITQDQNNLAYDHSKAHEAFAQITNAWRTDIMNVPGVTGVVQNDQAWSVTLTDGSSVAYQPSSPMEMFVGDIHVDVNEPISSGGLAGLLGTPDAPLPIEMLPHAPGSPDAPMPIDTPTPMDPAPDDDD